MLRRGRPRHLRRPVERAEPTFTTLWSPLKDPLSKIFRGADVGLLLDCGRDYRRSRTVYRICQRPVTTVALHNALIALSEEYLSEVAQDLTARSDEDLLTSFIQTSNRFTAITSKIDDVFMYFNWRGSEALVGREHSHFADLFLSRWDSFLFPKVQQMLKFPTWKMIVSHPAAELIQHPQMSAVVNTFCVPRNIASLSTVGIRPVFLATRPLNDHSTVPLPWSPVRHWGLVVGVEHDTRFLHEVEKVHLGTAIKGRRSFEGEGWVLTKSPIGYSCLDNQSIERYVSNFGMVYKPLSDNCQKFCVRLLECIRMPLHQDDIFRGVASIPPEMSNEILLRRCQEFEKLSYLQLGRLERPLLPMPLAIESIVRTSVELSPTLLLAIFLRSTMWPLAYLMAICLYAQYGKVFIAEKVFSLVCRPKVDPLRIIYSQLHPEDDLQRGTSNIQAGALPAKEDIKSRLKEIGESSDDCEIL